MYILCNVKVRNKSSDINLERNTLKQIIFVWFDVMNIRIHILIRIQGKMQLLALKRRREKGCEISTWYNW